jgi:hypothetical protein
MLQFEKSFQAEIPGLRSKQAGERSLVDVDWLSPLLREPSLSRKGKNANGGARRTITRTLPDKDERLGLSPIKDDRAHTPHTKKRKDKLVGQHNKVENERLVRKERGLQPQDGTGTRQEKEGCCAVSAPQP